MKIEDVMTPCPYQISATASLKQAIEMMDLRNIRHLPVVHDGNLEGLLSERDAKLSQFVCASTGYCPDVGTICLKDPYVVQTGTDVSDVAKEMSERKVDCVLVADNNGNFVGIFTSTDACRVIHLILNENKSK